MRAQTDLLLGLKAAADFEGRAVAALTHLLDTVDATLRMGDWPGARLLRAMVHLRRGGGYAGAWVLEAGAEGLAPPRGEEQLLPSATAWRAMAETGRPVVLDVALRTVTGVDGQSETVRWSDPRSTPLPEASQVRLQAREATHITLLPLIDPEGARGAISIEVRCRAAIGTPFVWPACLDALEIAAALAGPWLLDPRMALGSVDRPLPDRGLPVIGPTMAPIAQLVEVFAAEDETLLIRGETGTGKSRLARWCHGRSRRHGGPFVVLDLLAVPDQTRTGELFGWRRGAFTGAMRDHEGAVSRAEGGTLFIDEVDKLSLEAQAMLLRLLEEKVYRPLGDDGAARAADVRFIVGTNIDLGQAVREGRFRADLLYRIDVLPVALPPLRERRDEIADWARFMLDRLADERGSAPQALAEATARALKGRPWPGNLRQLDNVLRRAAALARMDGPPATLEPRHLQRAEGLSSVGGGDALGGLEEGLDGLLQAVDRLEAPPAVDWPGGLHGLLLARAVRYTGDRDRAFTLLGRGDVVANRNHNRTLKREWAKALALLDALGQSPGDRTPPG